jgi:transcriptional regulator with XRE-family HTH domain
MSRVSSVSKAAFRVCDNHGVPRSYKEIKAFKLKVFSPEQFAEQMIIRRAEQHVDRTTLSDILGYDKSTLLRWELGLWSPKLVAMADWANALNLELSLQLASRPALISVRS